MTKPPRAIPIALPLAFALLLALPPSLAPAALAPKSDKDLKKLATHIVRGEVKAVELGKERSRHEKGFGWHTDRIFTITLVVAGVTKGAGIKAGAEITVRAWQPLRRIPPYPGLQGHEAVPKKGDVVTVYLTKEGAHYQPLLPNGFSEAEKKKPAGEKADTGASAGG